MTKKKKTTLIVIIAMAAGVAVAVPLAIKHYSKPNFAKMNPRQIMEYFDSNDFRDANENIRREIRGQMFEAMRSRMEARVNDYFALPEGEQRTEYLDTIIDEMQQRMEEFRERRDPNSPPDPNRPGFGPRNANGRQRPRISPEQMRQRSGGMSAQNRVKMMQFRRDMFNRMRERGIEGPRGRGGFGRGFGRGPGGPPP
jgi:hypothetical protein